MKEEIVLRNFVNLKQLNALQLKQYRKALTNAFPRIINESPIIKKYWDRLEEYFPEHQLYLISASGDLIGFMNTIPFQFKNPLQTLPENGWDWMFTKGILDFEGKKSLNFLGGLQVIVRHEYQKMGYSKQILSYAKRIIKSLELQNIIIPIRPTKKHLFPNMPMGAYLNLKDQDKTYDPWLRTHLKGGAQVIKVCNTSMSITGDIQFWKKILKKNIVESGEYILEGALRPINMDVKNDFGEYKEPNVWIKYD